MNSKPIRDVYFYGEHFKKFRQKLNKREILKIDWTLNLIETLENIPDKYLRHIDKTDGLYEIRVEFESNIYRIFSFFDEGKLIVIINGFQKKTSKTPKSEIEKALKIKKQYFHEKQ